MSDKLVERKLNIDIPKTKEDIEFNAETNKAMKVFQEISNVFIDNNVQVEDSLVILEALSSAVQLYILQGITFGDIQSVDKE